MKRSLKKGLPGGPNEKVFSKEGYRSTSPDVNNPFNIIPSGSITMKEKDGTPLKKGPLLGIDNLGNSQLMLPGTDYQFPGNFVKEVPVAKKGGPFQNSNIYATNKLFAKNPLFKKRKKGKKAKGIYNPKAKYTYQPGGEIEYNELPNNYKDALKNFVNPQEECTEDQPCYETDQIQAIYDKADDIPKAVSRFELDLVDELWTDPKTGKSREYIQPGKPGMDARELWKKHGIKNFVEPSCMYVAGLGWRCAPETKDYMSNFNPMHFNSNAGFINAVDKGYVPFTRIGKFSESNFDDPKKGNLKIGDVVNFKGSDNSHAMTFMGYDENNKSIWFDSNGMPAHIDIHNIWEDLLPNNSGKGRDYAYVNRFDKDRYIKEVYGNQIKELEEKARTNPTYYNKGGGIDAAFQKKLKEVAKRLNDMVSVPSNREDLQVAKYGLELDLTEDEIQKYVKGGYVVEDISVPSLTRMDKGGNPIKQLQEKEKAAELSRLIASGAASGLGGMASYVAKEISKSQNKPSSNGSPARATAKPKMLAAVEKLASAPKNKPREVNLAVRDFVQDVKEIDLKSKKDPKKDPYKEKDKIIYVDGDKMELKYPDADARYKQWVMNIDDKNKNQSYFEDFGDWINENIFGAESDIERAYRSTYNPVKPKTYYYNGRQVTGNGPWNNWGDAPVQMVYPEMFFMGPSGGAAGIAGNTLKSGFNYGKNVIWPALNTALPLGEGITTATAGKITPFNIASLIFGSKSAANLANSDSESRKSLKKAYNNPTTSNILDAVGNVSYDVLGILGSPGVTNMFGSAAGGIGKLFAGSDDVIPNTEKLIKGLEKVPSGARPTNEQFKAVIDKNINYIKSPEYKKLRMQNTGETSAQVDKAVNSYIKKLNKTKLTSNKDDAFGTYTSGSLFSNPSINVDSYSMTPEKYLATFDHEIKHALSPFSGRGRYSLYKNYPILEGTPVYKEPSLREIFFGNSKSPIAVNRQYSNYHSLPYEQQVRALRLREKMKADLGISAETPLTEDDVYNWMSNYKYRLPEELGDVDDLLKQIKVGSADAEKTINVMEKPRNMADWMNKAWMLVPGAGVAGAAAYGVNDGANYKSGGLIETNDNSIVSNLTKKEIDKLIKQGYIIEEID